MGGGSYDRDVYSSRSSTRSYSTVSASTISKSVPTNDMLPSSKGAIACAHENPIVIAFDVTGSMGDAARVVYDKLPMFWGELVNKNYLPDPSVSFFAVGDTHSDSYPLQLCEFGEGIVLDKYIKKIYLEGGGGGQCSESYEMCAYYYAHCCSIPNAKIPFFFFIGDEDYYKKLPASDIKKYCDKTYREREVSAASVFDALKSKWKNVFLLHKKYGMGQDAEIVGNWKRAIGNERVYNMDDPKAVVDMMLGIIALIAEARTLDDYIVDMKARDQTDERIALIESNLSGLNSSLVSIVDTMPATSATTKRKGSSRL